MTYLDEVAAKVKWGGAFTEDWTKIRKLCFRDCCLEKIRGKNEMQKLTAWVDKQGMSMDFDFEFGTFSAEIKAVTFLSSLDKSPAPDVNMRGNELPETVLSDQTYAEPAAAQVGVPLECTVHNDFDWQAVESAGDGEGQAWAALSRESDHALVNRICELHRQTNDVHAEQLSGAMAATGMDETEPGEIGQQQSPPELVPDNTDRDEQPVPVLGEDEPGKHKGTRTGTRPAKRRKSSAARNQEGEPVAEAVAAG